jgi:ubiquinone/menaquinone biosynthesis C-methylase UbiE
MDQNPAIGEFINPDLLVAKFGLKENMHVADFGIGSGFFTILMAKAVGEGGSVTALDILEAPLEVVRNKAELEGLENINFVRADLEAERGSKLDDSSQDLVLLANILFQSNEKENIVKEAARIVKTGGIVIVVDWKVDIDALGGPPKEFRINPEKVKAMVKEIGLNLVNEFEAGQYHYGIIFSK